MTPTSPEPALDTKSLQSSILAATKASLVGNPDDPGLIEVELGKYQLIRKGPFWGGILAFVAVLAWAGFTSFGNIKERIDEKGASVADSWAESVGANKIKDEAALAMEEALGARNSAVGAELAAEAAAGSALSHAAVACLEIERLAAAVELFNSNLSDSLWSKQALKKGTQTALMPGDIFTVNVDCAIQSMASPDIVVSAVEGDLQSAQGDPHHRWLRIASSGVFPLKKGVRYRISWSHHNRGVSMISAGTEIPVAFDQTTDIRLWMGR